MHEQQLDAIIYSLLDNCNPPMGRGKSLERKVDDGSPTPPATIDSYASSHFLNNFYLADDFCNMDIDSTNSYDFDNDCGAQDAKKAKKGNGIMGKSIEEELCRICGDRASGYHYNALSCEGCKGFFRRSITKGSDYSCKYGGNCEMDMWMRRKCQSCRLRRCREVGMKEECLLSDDQCKARDARRKAKVRVTQKKTVKENSDHDGQCQATSTQSFLIPDSKQKGKLPPSSSSSSLLTVVEENPLQKLLPHEVNLIEKVVFLQAKFEFPSEMEYNEVLINTDEERKEATAPDLLKSMADMTVLITKCMVEFAKNLPGFREIHKEDQIVLLKAASSEMMTIRAARCYDLETQAIVFANGMPCTLENMKATGLGLYAELVYKFCHTMATMQTDNTEYALLTAICIFSDRTGLNNRDKVESVQKNYVDALEAYEQSKRLNGASALGKLLCQLSELRTISLEHSAMLMEVEMGGTPVPSLVKEVYIKSPDDL